jgi:predicted DNA-binding transcriptional regulator YafY
MSAVADTAARLLHLLSLLQRRADWSGPELADQLGVTTRTVRRDVDRLRSIGYPVDSNPGVAGGYRLGVGAGLPPLLLDDEEAVAVTVAVGMSASAAVNGIEDAALSALAKLDRVLPPALRSQVSALRASVVSLAPVTDAVDAETLVCVAQACQENGRLKLSYRDRDGQSSDRRVEPFRLVATGRRWYLLGYDLDRAAWRTLRLDRVASAARTGHRFVPRDSPEPLSFVGEAITAAPYRYRATVAVASASDELRRRVPPTVGVVKPTGTTSMLVVGGDRLSWLCGYLVALELPFEVLDPPELRDFVRRMGRQLASSHRTKGPRDGRHDKGRGRVEMLPADLET